MQGDFGAVKKVRKKLMKLGIKDKSETEEADELPNDSDGEARGQKLKQKLYVLLEKIGDEICEDGEVAKEKLKRKIIKLSEKLVKADRDEEEDSFEDADRRKSRLKEKMSRLSLKLKPGSDDCSEGEVRGRWTASGETSASRAWRGPSGRDSPNSPSDAEEGTGTGSEESSESEDVEGRASSESFKKKIKKLFDVDAEAGRKTNRVKMVYELLRREAADVDAGAAKVKVATTKSERNWPESSDTDRGDSETQSLGKPEAGEPLGSELKILNIIGQRLKERSGRVHRYFQRSGKISEVNRRLKSQIWSSVVTVVLVEGKNLQPMDIDGFSDSYVKFRLGNEKYKSKIAFKSLNPSWLEQFDFHLYDDQNQELEVTVWNKDKSKDDFMGRCNIDLSVMEREKTHGLWQDLEEGGGSIHLLLTISGTTASETISDLTVYEDNVRERSNIEKRYALRNSLHKLRDVGHLTVKVYRATGLAAADLGGKSDPFCVLELVNARLQTQTEYKTLSPSWQKIFTFNVKDINSVLEVTVYDEDRDHKVEFLGKVAIPLLRVRNGEKRWYCLKDKKLRSRAKGNCPMILLELYVIWNPIRAWIRTLNPKEEKYMQGEVKFKRQVFVRNVLRLKAIIMVIIQWGKLIQDCFEWESPAHSAVALIFFIILCYWFEPYMIPAALLVVFLKYYIVLWLTGEKSASDEEEDVLGEDDEDDDDKDKEEKKSLKERLQAIQEVTQSVQNAIGYIASLGEQIKNTFNFTVPFISYLAIGLAVAAMLVMYLIPLRYLIMIAGVNKFARKLIRPHTIPNNEILDLLSRVPDDEDLIAYREFRPYSSSDLERRREQRKKHKAS